MRQTTTAKTDEPQHELAHATIRQARPTDGQAVWQLVRNSNVLDVNSSYMYILMCDRFSDTCLVAELNNEVVGFVVAFTPPTQPDVVFVWQIGVSKSARGRGVAGALLSALVQAEGCRHAAFMETHIAPSNTASQKLFASFARSHGAEVSTSTGYATQLFPDAHEAEALYRIGPFTQTCQN